MDERQAAAGQAEDGVDADRTAARAERAAGRDHPRLGRPAGGDERERAEAALLGGKRVKLVFVRFTAAETLGFCTEPLNEPLPSKEMPLNI